MFLRKSHSAASSNGPQGIIFPEWNRYGNSDVLHPIQQYIHDAQFCFLIRVLAIEGQKNLSASPDCLYLLQSVASASATNFHNDLQTSPSRIPVTGLTQYGLAQQASFF